MSENEVIAFLEGLTAADFSRILVRIPGTDSYVPQGASHYERVAALLGYIKSSAGMGFPRLVDVLQSLFPVLTGVSQDTVTKSDLRSSQPIPDGHAPAGGIRDSELHGASGRWQLVITFRQWRGRRLEAGEAVVVHGYFDLSIPETGRGGVGVAHGTLTVELSHPPESGLRPYKERILVVDRIDKVHSQPDGGMTFQSETFSRFVASEEGDPPNPPVDGTGASLAGPTRFIWELSPVDSDPRRLHGTYAILGDSRDVAHVDAWKE